MIVNPNDFKKDVLVAALKSVESYDSTIKKKDYKNKDTIIKKLVAAKFDFNELPSKSNQKSIMESLKKTTKVLKQSTPKIKRFGEAIEKVGKKYETKVQKAEAKINAPKAPRMPRVKTPEQIQANFQKIQEKLNNKLEMLKQKQRLKEQKAMDKEFKKQVAYEKKIQKQQENNAKKTQKRNERDAKKLAAMQSVGPRFVGPLLPTQTRRAAKPRAPRTLNAI